MQNKSGNPGKRGTDTNRFEALQQDLDEISELKNDTRDSHDMVAPKVYNKIKRTPRAQVHKQPIPTGPKKKVAIQSSPQAPRIQKSNLKSGELLQKETVITLFPHQVGEARKEKEKEILKIMSQKQDAAWKNYQESKAASDDFIRQHEYPKSDEELAQIYALLDVGKGKPSSSKEPPDIGKGSLEITVAVPERESSLEDIDGINSQHEA
ncbi:hypothetical protein RIF29_35965 [Crotalaria pallida]|uniref:Uncharacterized protein n=1 Tax=Crotalaria pallida TaxID=3830 RepID=A0AAN9EAI7_CROPI